MHRSSIAAGLVALFSLFVTAGGAVAGTITVDSTADGITPLKGGCTLRDAVASANADTAVGGCSGASGADTIDFDPALAGATIDLTVVGANAAGNSALRISSDITILGDSLDGITIDAGGGLSKGPVIEMRHFYVGTRADDLPELKGDPGSPALTLENVTLSNGIARGGDGGDGSGGGGGGAGMGGAVFNDGFVVTIRNSTLTENIAIGGNGAFGSDPVDKSNPLGEGGGGGGGLAGDGDAGEEGFSGGSGGDGGLPNGGTPSGGSGGFGGGGAGGDGFDPQCVKGVIETEGDDGGDGGFGGGGGGGGEGTTVFGCAKSHLGGDGGDGGFGGGGGGRGAQDASFNAKGSAPPGQGGFGGGEGIATAGGGGAGMGGAVFSYFGTVNVINSTISGNGAIGGTSGCFLGPVKGGSSCPTDKGVVGIGLGLGGGIFMHDGTLDMNNATVSGNFALNGSSLLQKGEDAGDGGAVFIFDTAFVPIKSGAVVTINNSILANSEANNDFDTNLSILDKGDLGSGSNNIIEDNSGFSGGALSSDPQLMGLADNGGPNLTHLPIGDPDNGVKGPQSPAIGGGSNASCEAEDQRHFFRPAGPTCDIGSVEVGATGDDGDGVDAGIEDGAPNNGDGNNDGTMDSVQSEVASFPSATGNGYITLEIIEDCGQLLNVTAVDPATLPPNTTGGSIVDYPFGLVQFELPCESAVVEVLFQDATDLDGTSYDKYGPTTPGDPGTTDWYSFSDAGRATLTAPNVWTLVLDDGQLGDDTDGTDDMIFDQGGPGRAGAAIPAADWRGLGLLVLLLLVTGLFVRRRRPAM